VENRLRLADVDWGMVRRWRDEGAKRSPSTRLEMYDGRIPEAIWEDYSNQLTSLLNTMPFDDLDHGEIVVTPEHMRNWYEQMDIDGSQHHVILTREPDGVISGMTDLSWVPHHPKLLRQQFTGVRPSDRGRGLGKWIKAAMLVHVHELYPDARWIGTHNAGSNAPMLAINEQLGFKQYRAVTDYQISRERLAARAQELARSV
jgi:mycothiol synthase